MASKIFILPNFDLNTLWPGKKRDGFKFLLIGRSQPTEEEPTSRVPVTVIEKWEQQLSLVRWEGQRVQAMLSLQT